MKKNLLLSCFVLSLVITPALAYDINSFTGGVLCTKDRKICAVGKYKLSTTGSKPLQVGDGVVCMPDGNTCTNGYFILYQNNAIYKID